MNQFKNCPLCNEVLLTQSLKDSLYPALPNNYCPKTIKLPSRQIISHFTYFKYNNSTIIYINNYRIISYYEPTMKSKISTQSRYKTGKKRYFFKTIITTDFILSPNSSEEKFLNRIKTLLIFS